LVSKPKRHYKISRNIMPNVVISVIFSTTLKRISGQATEDSQAAVDPLHMMRTRASAVLALVALAPVATDALAGGCLGRYQHAPAPAGPGGRAAAGGQLMRLRGGGFIDKRTPTYWPILPADEIPEDGSVGGHYTMEEVCARGGGEWIGEQAAPCPRSEARGTTARPTARSGVKPISLDGLMGLTTVRSSDHVLLPSSRRVVCKIGIEANSDWQVKRLRTLRSLA